MNDLLNEEEFLRKEYNTDSWNKKFYIIGIVLTLFISTAKYWVETKIVDGLTILVVCLILITPLIISFFMVFLKKGVYMSVTARKTIKSIAILYLCCYGALITYLTLLELINIHTLGSDHVIGCTTFFVFYIVLFTLNSSIIYPIVKIKQKKHL